MVIPRKISILGREYKIRRKKMADFGRYDCDAATIWLKSGLRGEHAKQTLLHEVIHCILHESGQSWLQTDEQHESLVRSLEHGLWRAGYREIV